MNPLFDDTVRRVIPRWRSLATTADLGELGPAKAITRHFPSEPLSEKRTDWLEGPNLFVATDIVGSALFADAEEEFVKQAASLVVHPDSGATFIARRAAEKLLDPTRKVEEPTSTLVTRTEIYQRLHDTRHTLKNDPRNAIAWAEVSYLYTLVGQPAKASAAMRAAVSLAPHNRYILRSATRLFVHEKDPAKALWLLRRSDRVPHDPWLMAAEIGVAGVMSQTPRVAKAAIAAISSGDFKPRDISEIAVAMGTLEAEHGNRQKAKKLFRRALEDPNENVLAQAAWAARVTTRTVDISASDLNVPYSFEARARLYAQQKDWENAFQESARWLNDQRFSIRAAAYASYLAGVVLAQHENAVTILEEAAVANPDDWTLRNNLAFSLASIDRTTEAHKAFDSLPDEAENSYRHGVWLATSGLLRFRDGDTAEGQRLYDEAIELFGRSGFQNARANAAIFKAREELRANLETAEAALNAAKDWVSKATSPELETVLEHIDPEKVREQMELTRS